MSVCLYVYVCVLCVCVVRVCRVWFEYGSSTGRWSSTGPASLAVVCAHLTKDCSFKLKAEQFCPIFVGVEKQYEAIRKGH